MTHAPKSKVGESAPGEQNPAAAIAVKGVTKQFGSPSGTYTAVQGISLEAAKGRFVSVVGPSGCGKSTLLNIIAGLIEPTAGTVEIFGRPLTRINSAASYMFQQDALLPWKTVLENIELGLRFRRHTRAAAAQRAKDWIARVGLNGFADSYPHQLSGGMRKRVALAQSWIVDPEIVLMDEPFAALDVHTRHRMETEVLDLWAGSSKTVLFITHDLEEAIALSDEVIVLSAGPASHIIGRHAVDLPRPRNLIDIRTETQFNNLYRTIWADLRDEVLRSYERNPQ